MPTPASRPTDELVIEAVRLHVARLFGPSRAPRVIMIHVEGFPDPVTLPVPPCCPASTPANGKPTEEPFVPTDTQACVLEALEARAMKTGPLCKASGVSERELFRRPGGIQELRDRGLVSHHSKLGYWRPDVPPEDLPEDLR